MPNLISIPVKNTIIAILFIQCIALILKLVGRVGSFFLKKYINKKGLQLQPFHLTFLVIILF